jgi:phage/plasmid-like protein (TIGR03299 family)
MVQGAMTWAEAVALSNMGFTVEKREMFFKNPLWTPGSDVPKGFKIPDQYVICRTDVTGVKSILGIVGSQYEITQNVEIGGWMDKILGQIEGANYEAVGVLGRGERVWALARIPFNTSIGADKHETFLLFLGSHDGSTSNTLMCTDVRAVCQNTINMALSHATKELCLKVKHTKSAKEKLDKISEELSDSLKNDVLTMKEKFERLNEKKITPNMFADTMTKLFGEDWLTAKDNSLKTLKIQKIAELFKDNDGNAIPDQANTGMALVNALTNYTDHERVSRVTKNSGYENQDQARAASAMVGTGAEFKTDALDVVLELMETAEASTNPHPSVQVDKNNAVNRIMDLVS